MNLGTEKNVRGLKLSEQDRGEISEGGLDQFLQGLVGQGQGKKSGLHSSIREGHWRIVNRGLGRRRKRRMMCGDQTIRSQL